MAIQASLKSEDFRTRIQESRQKFLNVICDKLPSESDETKSPQNEQIKKKNQPRRISFKVRKQSSSYKKNAATNIQKTTITASIVAELASKFNQMIEKQNATKKTIKKLNSFNTNKPTKRSNEITKKPSLKKKPIIKEKPNIPTIKVPPTDKPEPQGFVRVAIENFEKKSTEKIFTRSFSEYHKPFQPIIDTETKRKSCQPEIKVPEIHNDSCYSITDILNLQPKSELDPPIKPNPSFLWAKSNSSSASTLHTSKTDLKEEIYEELDTDYEIVQKNYYEYPKNRMENIYEVLPSTKKQDEPLPQRPQLNEESDCYESIYNPDSIMTNPTDYESIYFRESSGREMSEIDAAGSIVSSEQKTNSLYGTSLRSWNQGTIYNGSGNSEISFSDKSEWIDVSDNEGDEESKFVILKEPVKAKKSGGTWSQQWSKYTTKEGDSDSDHHYETLQTLENESQEASCYDSFVSDVDSDDSFDNVDPIDDLPLPAIPINTNNNDVLTRLAASATKQMRRFTKNLTMTKNDISKSLTRIARRKTKSDYADYSGNSTPATTPTSENNPIVPTELDENNEKNRSLSRKGFLNKIRRSIIMSPEQANEITSQIKGKSTFYLTPTINIDDLEPIEKKTEDDSGISLSPIDRERNSRNRLKRPQNPPPPAPIGKPKERTSSTCWYDEVGLYPKSNSTPSTSSTENSGTNVADNNYYNDNTKPDLSLTSLPGDDIQMRLQQEPLYQFYDAAVLEYACREGNSDFDSDNYEDVGVKINMETRRPSAMELVFPKRNSLAFTKTLWCEIPEVLQSSVLSTLSSHQKKLQEAKFEMVTSEASYLNSLNVLKDHFIANLRIVMTDDDFEVLFGKIEAVRRCSDNLLLDLEKCWQDNILLHGVCDIVKKHAEDDFKVYIPYCENQIILDQSMKKLKENPVFLEILNKLEASPICQCLSLYSFLMLPMQRITRWPLLLDAVLKRLEPHDPEYITCQFVLATINKIVGECNEAARQKERELEMLTIESKLDFPRTVPFIKLAIPNRWLIRSGAVTHLQPKSDEIKLTFGRKISKATLFLFLFTDLLIITKPKGENSYTVLHYCSRNFIELSTSDQVLMLPGKDLTGKFLFFLTILENQHQKQVEFLLSCGSESDKQRWIEALSPPKSEDPDEVLYECWDCPQVRVVHDYAAVQPDEISLSKGDIMNVSRKMADGWYQGERITDGQTGWFPANYTVEIANPHVRARNLKQRYRFLTFSQNYLKNK